MPSIPTWPVAAGTFLAGFGVAEATDVRALGGLVLVAGGAWCARRWRAEAGALRAAMLVSFAFAAFVASHALADTLGSWGAVLAIAGAVAALAYVVADAPAGRGPLAA